MSWRVRVQSHASPGKDRAQSPLVAWPDLGTLPFQEASDEPNVNITFLRNEYFLKIGPKLDLIHSSDL